MRSITRSYFGGSSYLMPPRLMYSATTSPRPRSLMPAMSASGNVFSRPTRTPTRFISIECPFAKIKQNTRDAGACQTGIVDLPERIHATTETGGNGIFTRLCYNSGSTFGFPRLVPSKMRQSEFKENGYILLRPFLALLALGAFFGAMVLPDRIQAARVQQDAKQQQDEKRDAKD